MVLRQNTYANVSRYRPISQREDVGGVSGALTKTDDEDLSVDCQSKR